MCVNVGHLAGLGQDELDSSSLLPLNLAAPASLAAPVSSKELWLCLTSVLLGQDADYLANKERPKWEWTVVPTGQGAGQGAPGGSTQGPRAGAGQVSSTLAWRPQPDGLWVPALQKA